MVTFWSCQDKDEGAIQSIYEKDTTSIKYSFADLKHVIITEVKDTLTVEIMLRNLTDTIQYSNPIQSFGSFEYLLDMVATVSDTSTFKIEFVCARQDSTGPTKKAKFRSYFGKTVNWTVTEYIERGKLHFYKRYDAPYLRLTDTTLVLKIAKIPNRILKSVEKGVTVRVSYYWPDTLCEEIVWFDFLQSNISKLKEERGYIRTHCYADSFITGPQNDTIIMYAPYDIK